MEKKLNVRRYYQSTQYDCGIAILKMAIDYKTGNVHNENYLTALAYAAIHQENLRVGQGILPSNIAILLAHSRIHTATYSYPNAALSFQAIVKFVDDNRPIVIYIQNGLQGVGHYLFLTGYGTDASKQDKTYLIFYDPQEGEKYVYCENFPARYKVESEWLWGESMVLSWL